MKSKRKADCELQIASKKQKIEIDNNDLIDAIKKNQLQVVKFLIDKGFDINTKGKYGRSLLYNACMGGHLDIVKFLVEADPNLIKKDWEDCLNFPVRGPLHKTI